MRVGVLVSGRGSNLQALIDEWQRGALSVEIVAVGSDQPDCYALERAKKAGIKWQAFPVKEYPERLHQERALLAWLKEEKIELLLLAGYLKVLSPQFIGESQFPIINIHPSLLPAFPGLHAQKQAVDYGVKVSGCTVHFVDQGLDSGPIILQEAVPVKPDDTEDSLAQRILEAEHRLFPLAVRLVAEKKVECAGRRVIFKEGGLL